MNPVNPRLKELARRIVAYESRLSKKAASENSSGRASGRSSERNNPSAFSALERLRPRLAVLMSNGGVHALLLRTRALASEESPWLATLRIHPDGKIDVAAAVPGDRPDPRKATAGQVAMLGHLLALLQSFIGEILTLQLVNETWPRLPVNNLGSGRGD